MGGLDLRAAGSSRHTCNQSKTALCDADMSCRTTGSERCEWEFDAPSGETTSCELRQRHCPAAQQAPPARRA
jgi:hypothetical protein